MKLCRHSKKHKHNSRAAAIRAGTQRYGVTGNAYECAHCGTWHLTRRGVRRRDEDPQIEQLVDVLLGEGVTR